MRTDAAEATEELFVSADLQKVIMLPRAEMFKEVLFIPRIVAFNESIVPIGKNRSNLKPLAVIWHEAVAGQLNCLLDKHSKTGILKPNCRTYNRGVVIDRKETLLLKLRPIIPEDRIQFWENLPIYNCTDDLNRETDLADDMS
ncbi:hypothetical protein QE152_g33190 [Popillia japonica]|uniref:Uncharacterized protein n=1 Tax=Popillia japonica TaxID=7064 RepID=A0AAW1IXH8_POPJA